MQRAAFHASPCRCRNLRAIGFARPKRRPGKNRREVHNSAQFAVSSPCLRTSLETCRPEGCSLRNAKLCNAQHFTRAPAVAEIYAQLASLVQKDDPGKIAEKCTILHNSPFLRHACEPAWKPAARKPARYAMRDYATRSIAVAEISAIGFARSRKGEWEKS